MSDVTDVPVIDDETVTRAIDTHNAQYTRQFPWISPEVFTQINTKLRRLGLQGGTWDKEPYKIQATCSIHMQRQMANLTVADPNLRIIRVQKDP